MAANAWPWVKPLADIPVSILPHALASLPAIDRTVSPS